VVCVIEARGELACAIFCFYLPLLTILDAVGEEAAGCGRCRGEGGKTICLKSGI